MSRKRRRRIRTDRLAILLVILAVLTGSLVLFSGVLNRPKETPVPTPTPDPRYRNDYDWSKLAVSGDIFSYDDDQYTSSWGIDVSFHQGTIDWQKAAQSGIQFAMIRVGYRGYESGILNEDSQFRANMSGTAEAGVATGVYFFSSAITTAEAEEEASYVLNEIKDYVVTGPIGYDMENVGDNDRIAVLDTAQRTEIAAAFCNRIREAGYVPMIYGSSNWLQNMIRMQDLQDDYAFWLASYHEVLKEPDFPFVFAIWQYANDGVIDGIEKPCDLNLWIRKKS
jgi:GH25 family lysozyme M1 (1,4-beta-N-acetylmuramidase)